jgi:hypothetical protein
MAGAARLRVVAALLTGALAITAATAATRAAATHKHGPRPVAAVAVAAPDTGSHPLRPDLAADGATAVRVADPTTRWAAPTRTSESVSSGTADTAPARGPPGEAAA